MATLQQLQSVWQAVKEGKRRQEIAKEMHMSVTHVDRLYELARQRWGTGPRVTIAKTKMMQEVKKFERVKGVYSNKQYNK